MRAAPEVITACCSYRSVCVGGRVRGINIQGYYALAFSGEGQSVECRKSRIVDVCIFLHQPTCSSDFLHPVFFLPPEGVGGNLMTQKYETRKWKKCAAILRSAINAVCSFAQMCEKIYILSTQQMKEQMENLSSIST